MFHFVEGSILSPGLSFIELDQRLEKWIKFHESTITAATIHALALPLDITPSRTHVVHVKVHPRQDHNRVISKYFRIVDVQVLEISTAQNYSHPWPESINQLARLREESESIRNSTIAAAWTECNPFLAVQSGPFGSLRDLSRLRILPDWKEILVLNIYKHYHLHFIDIEGTTGALHNCRRAALVSNVYHGHGIDCAFGAEFWECKDHCKMRRVTR